MKKIAEGNNPHVINFIGCVTVQEPLCLITEFVKYGDLLSYLEMIRKLVRDFFHFTCMSHAFHMPATFMSHVIHISAHYFTVQWK